METRAVENASMNVSNGLGEVRRTRSFEHRRDELTQTMEEDEEVVEGEGLMNYRSDDAYRVGGITDALSLEMPRYEENPNVQNALRRRGRSWDVDGVNSWSSMSDAPMRPRTYTKSLGSLVKHLAPSADREAVVSPNQAPPSPRLSPLAKMMGALPKIWSPRSESGVAAAVITDYPIKYEFALILHNKPTTPRILARNGLDAVGKQQLEVIKRCIAAGLEISVLSSTLYSRKYMVLLLRPTQLRLQIEKSRLVLERWLQIGAVGEVPSEIEQLIASSNIGAMNTPISTYGEVYEDPKAMMIDDDVKFTPAERLQTIARIITSTSNADELNPPGAGISIDEQNRKDPIITSCFPLHNRRANAMILSKSAQWWWRSSEITNELQFYYGERVAFYFSFIILYTKCLLIPAIIGSALYFSLRWYGAVEYMRGLCIFGFCTATIWGTFFLKAWARKNNFLNDAWNLRMFKEADYPNSTFKPQGYRDVVDSHGVLLFREPYYNPIFRIPAYMQTFVVFTIFIVTYVLGITFFVQWYTAAMMAPLCSKCPDCKTFLSCFDTERPTIFTIRWGYILVQGIILGVSLDIFVYLLSVKLIHFFVVRENHATERQFQRTMINRLFVINWISFFLWFILIAFVIVPFGETVETWLSENFKYKKLTVDWENGVIDMSTALVTPLLITQALNLLIDTAVPYALRKETLRASKMARKIMRANPAETLLALSEYQSSFENLQQDNAQTPSTSLGFKAKIELQMMTPIRIPYIEKELGVSINTLEGFENEKVFMTADDVLEESQMSLYNPFPDYLRMVIQYGYVVMFSVVWPFCALAGFVNNIIHIQNSFNKLFLLRRRPVPRKANNIGQWEKMLFITLILAVFIVVGLICVSSGELEYFLAQCTSLERFNGKDFNMYPDFSCVDLSSRFLVALVLEHAAILIVFLMMDFISDTPASVRSSFQRKKELIRRAIGGRGKAVASVPHTPSSTVGAPTHSYDTV
ncbi:hypothetical protein Poli38472_002157 [Pythium oligandrum]|uniref:Anoctamin transmembrane domain-containing protein n=1 Tax=Pythium oligandrum TaxID=41045 RepID=A0A8K1CGQ4_PYTOL|nr:hypothetical protein Poli38472_002157 [Pythium oligandrum]|eukprot:TMW63216.1 hypothetical protein Poli38472_002157 [Pythium oligandrum]